MNPVSINHISIIGINYLYKHIYVMTAVSIKHTQNDIIKKPPTLHMHTSILSMLKIKMTPISRLTLLVSISRHSDRLTDPPFSVFTMMTF